MELSNEQATRVLEIRARIGPIQEGTAKVVEGGVEGMRMVASIAPEAVYNVVVGLSKMVEEQQTIIDDILREQ